MANSKTRPRRIASVNNEEIEAGITLIKVDGRRIRIEVDEYKPPSKEEELTLKVKKNPFKKRGKSRIINLKPVVIYAGVTSVENLPYPIVHYPASSEVFIAFQKEKNQPLYFCSCTKYAIENFFRMSEEYFNEFKSITTAGVVKRAFPIAFIAKLRRIKAKTAKELLDNIPYATAICHECNGKLPAFRYISDYYGFTFVQNYGWYLYKQAYEFGINKGGNIILDDCCPEEIRDLVTVTQEELTLIDMEYKEIRKVNQRRADDFLYKAHQPLRKQQKRIKDYIENIVRDKFGHKKIGEAWINETMLYYILCTLYPDKTILRHHHPTFLKGLELDVYFPEEKLGIEYQGIQHFETVSHWGGEEALIKLQKRDKLKQELCKANQINLIYFLYDEILSDALVEQKIKEFMSLNPAMSDSNHHG
jgi:hypothetical protein